MGKQSDFAGEWFRWLSRETISTDIETGWTEIVTPFQDRRNDGITVYAKREGGNITLSDDGDTLSDVFTSSRVMQRHLENILNAYGIENRQGELLMSTTDDDFAPRFNMFLQALLEINCMVLLHSQT